jgi:hypothetical protein
VDGMLVRAGSRWHHRTLNRAPVTSMPMLPEALDPDALRTIVLVALGTVAVVTFLVMRMIQKVVLKIVLVGALAGLGTYLWSERADLDDCRQKCPCTFASFEVQVPWCKETVPPA